MSCATSSRWPFSRSTSRRHDPPVLAGGTALMALYEFEGHRVAVPASGRFWVADTAIVIGMVVIEEDASIWFNAVVRGDNEPIVIGAGPTCRTAAFCTRPRLPPHRRRRGHRRPHGHAARLHDRSRRAHRHRRHRAERRQHRRELPRRVRCADPRRQADPGGRRRLGSPGKIIRQVTEQDLERMRWGVQTYVDRGQAYARVSGRRLP